jgi:outer membrane receptor protein involved in Fe transport
MNWSQYQRQSLIKFITVLLAMCSADAARADETRRTEFHIAAQDAAAALTEFSDQWMGGDVTFEPERVSGHMTHAVNGVYDGPGALSVLLDQTGLAYTITDKQNLAIAPVQPLQPDRLDLRPRNPRLHAPLQNDLSKSVDAIGQVIIDRWRTGGIPPQDTEVIILDRPDIEQTGFVTIQDFLTSLPQDFGGGPREDTLDRGRESATNSGKGRGVNLRGLGAGATLVLINGRRLAPGGSQALFVDISSIPLAAVERIEVQPDGASALYGADAIGGVVNFIMRDDFKGRETHAQFGAVTNGGLKEQMFSQLAGIPWNTGHILATFEYYRRDALWADDRRYATSDLSPFGGRNFDVPSGNPGTLSNGRQTWAIPHGQNGSSLGAADLVSGTTNLYDPHAGTTILPRQQRESAFISLRNTFDSGTHLFVDALFSVRDVFANSGQLTAPLPLAHDPFFVPPKDSTGPYTVLYGFGSDLGSMRLNEEIQTGNFTVGAGHAIGQWTLTGYAGYAFEKENQRVSGLADFTQLDSALKDPVRSTAFNPLGDGSFTNPATLARIAAQSQFRTNSVLKLSNLQLEGPLLPLPGGYVRIIAAGDYRGQTLSTTTTLGNTATATPINVTRGVTAAFGELKIPIFGFDNDRKLDNRIAGLRQLDLDLAVRVENFNDFGSAVAPKLGIVWSPLGGLLLRASVADSFKAPNMIDLVESNNGIQLITLPDPSSPSGSRPTLLWFGNNKDLHAERARSWAVEAEIGPNLIKNLSFNVTYFDVVFRNRIQAITPTADLLENPAFESVVNRNPTAAERANVCSRGTFSGNPTDCLNAQVGAIADVRLQNIALLKTSGIDLLAKYYFPGAFGKVTTLLRGTYLLRYAEAQTRDSPMLNMLNTIGNPVNTRLRGVVAWERRGFQVIGALNFTNGYRDTSSQPNRSIASFTTADLKFSYGFDATNGGLLKGTGFSVDVRNVLNRATPFVNNPIGVGYDPSNGDLVGRLWSLNVGKRW